MSPKSEAGPPGKGGGEEPLPCSFTSTHIQQSKYPLANTAEQTRASVSCQAELWSPSCPTKGNSHHFCIRRAPSLARHLAYSQGILHLPCSSKQKSWFRASPRAGEAPGWVWKEWTSLSTPRLKERPRVTDRLSGYQRAEL